MRWAGCALGLFALLGLGCRVCPPRMIGGSCTTNADCATPLFCGEPATDPERPEGHRQQRYCTRPCRSSADCGGRLCTGGLCDRRTSTLSWEDLIMETEEHPVPFEVAPWLAAGGAERFAAGGHHARPSLGAGVEGTFRLPGSSKSCFDDASCELPRLRLGPWLAVDSTLDRTRGEGGIAFDLGGPRQVSWSTYGLRIGAGYANTRAADVVGQLSWGTRFVKWRSRGISGDRVPCPAVVALVSGLRLFVAARRELDGPRGLEVAVGLEWRPFARGAGIFPWSVVWN